MLLIKVFESDIPRNIEIASRVLWKETFGDSDAYIDIVYGALARKGILAVAEDDGCVVAHLVALPYNGLCGEGNIVTCLYLCGLATLPHYRRRGIMGELIHKTNQLAFLQGYGRLFLIPANDELRRYYLKFGFVTDSHRKIYRIERERFWSLRQSNGKDADRDALADDVGEIVRFHQMHSMARQKAFRELYAAFTAAERGESPIRILHDEKAFFDCVKENGISGGEVLFSPESGDFMFLEQKGKGELFSPWSSFFRPSVDFSVPRLFGFVETAFGCFGRVDSISLAFDFDGADDKTGSSAPVSILDKVSSVSILPYGMSCVLDCNDGCPGVTGGHLGISLMLD